MNCQETSLTIEEVRDLDFSIEHLGDATMESPLQDIIFVEDDDKVAFYSDVELSEQISEHGGQIPSFEAAGPREHIYHDPTWTRAAIVTCGGLCPGINDVIRALVNTLYFTYGVDNVFGIQYGFRGLVPTFGLKPVLLTPDNVDTIHENGGTILGTSRGMQPTDEIIKTLDRLNINVLFTIGGDGTQRGARDIAVAARERGLAVSVVGIPKTIDNDLNFMERTFGFETAVYCAAPIIGSAHNEAKGAYNGIGLVRLMGRDSGFIAAYAVLANSVVNFCLIPEVHFEMEGPEGFLAALERRLEHKHHAVIVVAEGAGQDLFGGADTRQDKSGNVIHHDIGLLLRDRISEHLSAKGIEHAMKYFDPSYIIRSVPAHGTDAVFCLHLAQHAVHAAMAGKTNMVVGYWHGRFVNIPIDLAARSRRKIDPRGQLWQSVRQVTQQDVWNADEA